MIRLRLEWSSANAGLISGCCTTDHTHTRLTALCLGLPGWVATGWVSTRNVKPIWILLKQETVSGSGISWAICKSAPRTRQITMPAPHHSVFYRPDALPAAQPTASKHWRHCTTDQCWHNQLVLLWPTLHTSDASLSYWSSMPSNGHEADSPSFNTRSRPVGRGGALGAYAPPK